MFNFVNSGVYPAQAVTPKDGLEFSLHQPNDVSSNDEEDRSVGSEDSSLEQKKDSQPKEMEECDYVSSMMDGQDNEVHPAEVSKEANPAEISEVHPAEVSKEANPAEISEVHPAEINKEAAPAPQVLQGQINYTVPSGTPIKMKLAAVPSHTMKSMDRDFDGNLYPARLGQQITAKTTEDIYVDHNKIIPEGTTFCGEVSKILPPRRVGRPGSLVLSFDRLITPDGRRFAFRAEANNFKASTYKSKAKGFGIIAYHAAGGAVVGALVAYQICGLQNTIAMHGYNIAAGAAGGALIATAFAIMRKGPQATLEPGDDLNISIDSDLLMPLASETDTKAKKLEMADIKMEVEKSKIVSDGLGDKFVTVEVTIMNETDSDLSSIDLFLEDSNGDRHPLCSSPEENSQFLFHIDPHSKQHLRLAFLTQYPKLKQQLVWVDHCTKIALARQKIQ